MSDLLLDIPHDVNSEPALLVKMCFELKHEPTLVIQRILETLFKIGAVGIKAGASTPVVYSYGQPDALSGPMPKDAKFYVHPALHRALDVRTSDTG